MQDDNWENFSKDIVQKMRQIIYLMFYYAMVGSGSQSLGLQSLGLQYLGLQHSGL